MTTTYRELGNHSVAPCAEKATLDVDASGDLETFLGPFTGILDSLILDIGSLATSTTTDITVTIEETGEQVFADTNITADAVIRPRVIPQGTDGAELDALKLAEAFYLVNDRLKVVVDEGGNEASGALTALIK